MNKNVVLYDYWIEKNSMEKNAFLAPLKKWWGNNVKKTGLKERQGLRAYEDWSGGYWRPGRVGAVDKKGLPMEDRTGIIFNYRSGIDPNSGMRPQAYLDVYGKIGGKPINNIYAQQRNPQPVSSLEEPVKSLVNAEPPGTLFLDTLPDRVQKRIRAIAEQTKKRNDVISSVGEKSDGSAGFSRKELSNFLKGPEDVKMSNYLKRSEMRMPVGVHPYDSHILQPGGFRSSGF